MATSTLEERVALLEQEVVQLRRQIDPPAVVPWWEQISGVFAEVPAFDEAAGLGRRYREAQRPAAGEETDASA
ncbi:MAG TPA: hypothetical protein VLA19_33285 [Herpetosiphonaceae bacterium]|nr:hypothetical protein [Herpetosiphonaceae bacterium]